jgi:hypothetical protein
MWMRKTRTIISKTTRGEPPKDTATKGQEQKYSQKPNTSITIT